MSDQNQPVQKPTPWGTIIIVILIFLFIGGYIQDEQQRRETERFQQDVEAAGTFIGSALREFTK